ncbi:MAG: hypothetical protein BWY75_01316 [bacterium ADurb.Bin425]|nr:MAG: hypothetical protein BWY75_01316 [bacterium ADurb.Bin425]
MVCSGTEHVSKLAEYKGSDRSFFVRAYPDMVQALFLGDVEMIEPEIGHHFFQLLRAFGGPFDSGQCTFFVELALVFTYHFLDCFVFFG